MWSAGESTPALLLLLSTLFQPAVSVSFNCEKVVAGDSNSRAEFNFKSLGGSHQVSWRREELKAERNTTYTIDICNHLKFDRDSDEKDGCGSGTHICAVEAVQKGDTTIPEGAFPIVRNWIHDHAELNPKYTRLKNSASHADSKKEGLRLEIGGGYREKRPQQAIIEFVCDKNEATERNIAREDARDEGGDGGDSKPQHPEWEAAKRTDDGAGGEIKFESYDRDGDKDILRLTWKTPHGCEDAASKGDGSASSSGWGFFSWFFFIVFMGLLSFVLFTAWVNYTRHGLRGWDLLPYSDTIRDVPYILGDWGRKIVGTLNGGGSRGGYSAV